jgi:hypothetical protein
MDEPTKLESGPLVAVPVPPTVPVPRARALGRRAWIAIIGGAVALLGLVGLGIHQYLDSTHNTYIPAAKPVASAGVPEGWSQYREPASGFAIQLPPGWSSIGYDVLANQAILEKNYPQFAAIVKQYGDPAKVATKVKFIAANDTRTAIFIVFKRTGTVMSFDDYIPAVLPAYGKLGAQQLEHHRVTLPAGEAERFAFTLTITGTADPLQLRYVQYHFLKTSGGQTTLFVLQYIVAGTGTDSGDATLDEVTRSFRIL